jgi:hypothetical protein
MSQLEIAKHRLFDGDAIGAVDIKLFPGSDRDTTPERFAEEINRAISRIEAGDFEIVEEELSDVID